MKREGEKMEHVRETEYIGTILRLLGTAGRHVMEGSETEHISLWEVCKGYLDGGPYWGL
jgi:hypothetical protein